MSDPPHLPSVYPANEKRFTNLPKAGRNLRDKNPGWIPNNEAAGPSGSATRWILACRILRITGPCFLKGFLLMCIAGVWDLQNNNFEILWFLGGIDLMCLFFSWHSTECITFGDDIISSLFLICCSFSDTACFHQDMRRGRQWSEWHWKAGARQVKSVALIETDCNISESNASAAAFDNTTQIYSDDNL